MKIGVGVKFQIKKEAIELANILGSSIITLRGKR